jgi:hypothetical protein
MMSLMAKTVIVKLTDDLDGSDADETVSFGLDGKMYEIDLNKKNATALRKAIGEYIEKGRASGRPAGNSRSRRSSNAGGPTLFSQLESEEKDRFRAWAGMLTARRIGDARVKEWIEAGRP